MRVLSDVTKIVFWVYILKNVLVPVLLLPEPRGGDDEDAGSVQTHNIMLFVGLWNQAPCRTHQEYHIEYIEEVS